MLNHILVPLDGSQLAEAALETAQQIVSPTGTLTLLSVINTPELPVYDFYPTPLVMRQNYEQAIAEAVPRAKEYLDTIADDLVHKTNVHVNTKVEPGDPAATILDVAERLDVNAIVMSTHGRSGLGLWLFGSVTHKVLSAAPCPVFVVPSRASKKAEAEPEGEKARVP